MADVVTWSSAGRVLPLPKDAYDAKETYNLLDIVSYGKGSYIAKKTSIGVTPGTDDSAWMLLVASSTAEEQDIQDAFDYVFS